MKLQGFWLFRAFLWTTFVVVECRVNLSNPVDVPATFGSSAFANELYHGLNAKYRSCPCFPRRIHLSQASNVFKPEESTNQHHEVNMTVSFSLDNNLCRDVTPTVVYGRGLHSEGKATSDPVHFNYTSAVTGEFYESDLIYHVKLRSLIGGNQRYWYRIQVDGNTNVESTNRKSRHLKTQASVQFEPEHFEAVTPTMSFATPPLPGSPTTIALIGDLGQTEDSTVTMAHMYRAVAPPNTDLISLVMFAGDLSYADGEPYRWIQWLDLMEPLFRAVPVHVSAGNHEIEYDDVTGIPFQFYENLFRNPNRLGPAERTPASKDQVSKFWRNKADTSSMILRGYYDFGNSFYAVDHGLLHIIALSSYSDVTEDSAQYKWLKKHLPSIDRSVTPWLIVVYHAPFYTPFVGHVREFEPMTMKRSMEPLFVEYKVNMVFSGHDHGYMRTHPLAFGKVDTTGMAPVYLTVGAGGNREHHAPGYRHEEQEEWIAKRDRFEYGYGHLHVANATHAKLDWVRDGYTAYGLQDSVWMFNPHSN